MLLASSHSSSFSHQPFGTLLAASDDLSAALTAPAPYQTFEPVVNVPALGAFAFVTVVFGLLQLRINRVQTAAERRKAALESLRVVKSLQLGADDFSAAADVDEEVVDVDTKPAGRSSISEASVRAALDEYEAALREEVAAVLPGRDLGDLLVVATTQASDLDLVRTGEAVDQEKDVLLDPGVFEAERFSDALLAIF